MAFGPFQSYILLGVIEKDIKLNVLKGNGKGEMVVLSDRQVKELHMKGAVSDIVRSFYGEGEVDFGTKGLMKSDGEMAELMSLSRGRSNNGLQISPIEGDQIQPASIELRVGCEVWELNRLIPIFDRELLDKHSICYLQVRTGDPLQCNPGYIYVFSTFEKIKLPNNLEGITDTKSTPARVGGDCAAQDRSYAKLRAGFPGSSNPENLYFKVDPHSFPLILKPGETRLIQMRLREVGTGQLSQKEIVKIYGNGENKEIAFYKNADAEKLSPIGEILVEDSLQMTMRTTKIFRQRKEASKPLDLTLKDYYDPTEYFDLIEGKEEIVLEPNILYLFGTNEIIKLGKGVCGSIIRTDPYLGAGVRTQLAGFIDPGWEGRITYEIWSDKRLVLRNGWPVGRVQIEKLSEPVETPYGDERGSSYKYQDAPKLPKIFKTWPEFRDAA